jgi:Zn-dependent protease
MVILGAHELGHFFAAKRHGVAASLPFFIPMPPFPLPIGTLGAFISMREPIPNKKALLDIGVAGPIVGFIIAIPVTIIGLFLTDYYSVPADPLGEGMAINSPLIIMFFQQLLPLGDGFVNSHPTFFAGWVGIFVTALNLLPVGQLDGGHVFRALFGRNAKFVGYATVVATLVISLIFQFVGFLFLIMLMALFGGMIHPPPLNDFIELGGKRKVVGALAVAIFLVSFHPLPLAEYPAPTIINLDSDLNGTLASPGVNVTFQLVVSNDARKDAVVEFSLEMNGTKMAQGWDAILTYYDNATETPESVNLTPDKPLKELIYANTSIAVNITVYVPANATSGDEANVTAAVLWTSREFEELAINGVEREKRAEWTWTVEVP